MTALRLCLVLLLVLSSYAYGEPALKFLFSVRPHDLSAKGREMRCLGDPFEPGLNVVLVRDNGTCAATIAGPCDYHELHYRHRNGSRLVVDDKCWRHGFTLAVVGVDYRDVRVIRTRVDKSPLPKGIESRARQSLQEYLGAIYQLLPLPPSVVRVESAKLVTFKYRGMYPDLPLSHAPVLIMGNHVFPLAGTIGHLFFSVNGRLHLACRDSGVIRAQPVPYILIWDLSDETPKLVFYEADRLRRR